MKVFLIEEHNEIVPLIIQASDLGFDYTFINVDSHSDMAMYKKEEGVSIGTFISYCMYINKINDYLWIKNDKNLLEFEDGLYKFKIWEEAGQLVSNLAHKFFYMFGDCSTSEPLHSTKDNNFQVISESSLHKTKLNNKKWFLSIDCDYFGCKNPFKNKLNKFKKSITVKKYEYYIDKYINIKNTKDCDLFLKEISLDKKNNVFSKLGSSLFDEITFSEQEIIDKTNLLFDFLKKNFDNKDCLGVVVCKSLTSGYVNEEKLPFILNTLSTKIKNHFT